MNNWRTWIIILLLIDPHCLESRQWSKDRSSEPSWVLSLRRSKKLNLSVWWSELVEFLPHSFTHSLEKSRATSKDDILQKFFSDVHIAFHDRIVAVLGETLKLISRDCGSEQDLRALESFTSYCNFLAIRKIIILLAAMRFARILASLFEIGGCVA